MSRDTIEINPDIRRARTLPAAVYSDQHWFDLARDLVFSRSWNVIGDTSMARTPRSAHPAMLLESCLDEPLLLTRDDSDQLRCLSNVCTHRGALVCENTENSCAHLRCRYHGRRFKLDGAFASMPEFEDVENFPTEADNLTRLPLEQFGPLLFTSLNPAHSYADLLAPVHERIGWMPLESFQLDPNHSRDYLVRANWALYCDNYLEGFHIPFVHEGLADTLDYGAYDTELFDLSSLQVGVAKDAQDAFDLPTAHPDHGRHIAGYYFFLYPATMLNFYPWGLSLNIVKPINPALTRVQFRSFVWDASRLDQGAGAALDRVEREDEEVVESVQMGVRSRLYNRGRYSPAREQAVHHFHRLLAASLNRESA